MYNKGRQRPIALWIEDIVPDLDTIISLARMEVVERPKKRYNKPMENINLSKIRKRICTIFYLII